MEKKKIAIVGSGISGMLAAYQLHKDHNITLFESGDYIGGHTHTVDVNLDAKKYAVDTGFIVCNDNTYPNFMHLMDKLGVELQNTTMSFSVTCERTRFEYGTQSLEGFLLAHANILRWSFHKMLFDMLRFNRRAKRFLNAPNTEKTFDDFLRQGAYSEEFSSLYLVPMLAAIWSADPAQTGNMPAAAFLNFFKNHGMLNIIQRPQWKVIKGGSREYVKKLVAPYQDRIRLNAPVHSVTRHDGHVNVSSKDGTERFDDVILAVHSDTALRLLADASVQEREILGAIPYQKNEVTLHTDTSLLPKYKSAWAAWNYRMPSERVNGATLTYNMNMLQGLDAPKTFCVSLNQNAAINPDCVIERFIYDHPLFTKEGIAAQSRHAEISGKNRTHFCGAYWGNGFHEDGVNSALAVCAAFGKGAIQ